MFSVDFPLSRLFRSSSRLAGIALALTLSAGLGVIATSEADASGRGWHKSGGHYSARTHRKGSRHVSRHRTSRHYGQHKYRSHRRQYRDYHRSNYANHLFSRRSLKDMRSSGVRLGHRNYRVSVSTHDYGRVGLVITNQNGVRIISNYGASYGSRYNSGPSINGVSLSDKCPLNFNCGLRAYTDNSGPRIITLGKGNATVNDPAIEIIGPPKVITYSDSIN